MLVLRFESLALAEHTPIWIILRKQKGRAFPRHVIGLRMPALTDWAHADTLPYPRPNCERGGLRTPTPTRGKAAVVRTNSGGINALTQRRKFRDVSVRNWRDVSR